MRRRAEQLLPVLVLIGFLAAAVVLNLLLSSAQDRSIGALEDSVQSEVSAISRSQDQRFLSTLTGTGQVVSDPNDPYELEAGSAADLVKLNELLELFDGVENFRSGFYVVDIDGTITQGVRLLEPSTVGSPFDWPGFDELTEQETFVRGTSGGILPVDVGLTTNEPAVALVFPIIDLVPGPTFGTRVGAFVFESVVAADSDFNKEIGTLERGETGQYLFYDNMGSVVAANDPSLLGHPLDEERLLTDELGVHRYDGRLVVVDEVPSAGWRVAFRQDIDEFEDPLAAPLESAGRIAILVILVAGFLFTIALYRRLRAARAEQERLRELSEAQQELISIVSHELRTPVAGVLGFLETTLDHWDGMEEDERRRAVSRAAANAQRLQAMTRDVLDTQNVESGRLVHVMQPLDLAAEVTSAVDAAQALAPDRTFSLEVPDGEVVIDGDADRIHQVLANLLDNAQKSSPAVEPIEVEVLMNDGHVEVCVHDHGAGIAEESLDRIFDKFVRERGDTVSGTGLGLYIARQILDAHGGRIWAESQPGEGATFHLTIPLKSVASKL